MFSFEKRHIQRLILFLCSFVLLGTVSEALASRQFYTNWKKGARGIYKYSVYYYKVNRDSEGFRSQYLIYYPQQPEYFYFYDPVKKEYWGRIQRVSEDLTPFSLIPPESRAAKLNDLPADAFDHEQAMPYIPSSNDDVRILLPTSKGAISRTLTTSRPSDLPVEESLPNDPIVREGEEILPPGQTYYAQKQRTARIIPKPKVLKYRVETRIEVQYVRKVQYDVGYYGLGGCPILVPRVFYQRVEVPVRVRVPYYE